MKLRQHRGGFEESMATMVEIPNTQGALIAEMTRVLGDSLNPATVQVVFYCHEPRQNWGTAYMVTSNLSVYGFTDGPLADGP